MKTWRTYPVSQKMTNRIYLFLYLMQWARKQLRRAPHLLGNCCNTKWEIHTWSREVVISCTFQSHLYFACGQLFVKFQIKASICSFQNIVHTPHIELALNNFDALMIDREQNQKNSIWYFANLVKMCVTIGPKTEN